MRYVASTIGINSQMICDLMVEAIEYRLGKGKRNHRQIPDCLACSLHSPSNFSILVAGVPDKDCPSLVTFSERGNALLEK